MVLSSLCCNAGLGNFTKAVGKGMGNPCFRIIQTHFAKNNNVGDVAAKEQVRSAALHLQNHTGQEIQLSCHDPNVVLFVCAGHSLWRRRGFFGYLWVLSHGWQSSLQKKKRKEIKII